MEGEGRDAEGKRVFGALAADAMIAEAGNRIPAAPALPTDLEGVMPAAEISVWTDELRALMWRDAGLLRDAAGLHRAEEELATLALRQPKGLTRAAIEARNLYTVATVIVASALAREESRGAHYRNDFPQHDAIAKHSIMERGQHRFTDSA